MLDSILREVIMRASECPVYIISINLNYKIVNNIAKVISLS